MAKKLGDQEFRIIWAIDAEADLSLQKTAIVGIKALIRGRRATVEPVYLLSTFLDSAPSQSFGDTLSLTEGAIRERFEKLTARFRIPSMKPLTLLTGTDLSMRRRATELSDYAKSRDADVIVLASHGRKGIKRWFLGSFAESMMQLPSGVPLLITNPHGKLTPLFGNILFPTDFSDESKEAYLRVIDFAKHAHSRISIFHRISLTISPELHLMATNYPDYARVRRRAAADARAQGTDWAREGLEREVKVTVSIDTQGMSSVADAILKQQRRTGGLIALASRSGDAPPLLMGTTTRTVVQGSTSAVWVLVPTVDHSAMVESQRGSKSVAA